MFKIQEGLDYILSKFRSDKVKIKHANLVPVEESGLEMSCFTPLNISYPDSYDRNLRLCNGDSSKVRCWSSPQYHECSPLAVKNKIPLNHSMDCTTCDFTLSKAHSFNLRMTIANTELDDSSIISHLNPLFERINSMLPKPLGVINITSEGDFGIYNRRISVNYNDSNPEERSHDKDDSREK